MRWFDRCTNCVPANTVEKGKTSYNMHSNTHQVFVLAHARQPQSTHTYATRPRYICYTEGNDHKAGAATPVCW